MSEDAGYYVRCAICGDVADEVNGTVYVEEVNGTVYVEEVKGTVYVEEVRGV